MTKVSKRNIDAFKNLKLTPKKTAKIKGGQADFVIEELLDN